MLNLLSTASGIKAPVVDCAPGGDIKKKLRWHTAQEDPHAVLMLISPAHADEMLRRNVGDDYRNRPNSQLIVDRYAKEMAEGRWALTGETIIFSTEGDLLNGQHRLMACIKAGVSFPTFVAFGVPRDGFKFMDTGRTRSAGDVFAIEGIKNWYSMAAATKWVMRIRDNNGSKFSATDAPTNDDLLHYYQQNDGLQDSAWVGQKIGTEGESLIAPALMTALHYLFAQKSRSDADDFMRKVITGVGIASARDPEHVIRKWLLKDNSEVGGRTADTYRAAYVTLAWNARRTNRAVGSLRWKTAQNPNLPYPTIR